MVCNDKDIQKQKKSCVSKTKCHCLHTVIDSLEQELSSAKDAIYYPILYNNPIPKTDPTTPAPQPKQSAPNVQTTPAPKYPPLKIMTIAVSKSLSHYQNSDAAITIQVEGGKPPYNYRWSNGATTQNLSNIGAGFYSVTVTDQLGNSTTDAIEILPPQQPVTQTPTQRLKVVIRYVSQPTSNIAKDAVIAIDVKGGVPPYTYKWSTGDTSKNLTAVGVGNYTVTVTDQQRKEATNYAYVKPPEQPIEVEPEEPAKKYMNVYVGAGLGFYPGNSVKPNDKSVIGINMIQPVILTGLRLGKDKSPWALQSELQLSRYYYHGKGINNESDTIPHWLTSFSVSTQLHYTFAFIHAGIANLNLTPYRLIDIEQNTGKRNPTWSVGGGINISNYPASRTALVWRLGFTLFTASGAKPAPYLYTAFVFNFKPIEQNNEYRKRQ
jgi:hypothetical protein